ncbi:MAG: hypothetical protein H6735_25700 [Alphaproteobacteria bacterium]|nr:hypothetical protein [Alphaproteobacteria bacterium]
MTLVSTVVACASVTSHFEEARLSALEDPGVAPTDFAPDAEILLSGSLLEGLADEAVAGQRLTGTLDLGLVAFRTSLRVRHLAVVPAEEPDAIALAARLDGTLTARSLLGDTSTPIGLDAVVEAALGVDRGADGAWLVAATPSSIRQLELEVPGMARGAMDSWLQEALLEVLPPFVIAAPDEAGLPVRGIRAHASDGGVRIDLRTAAPRPEPLRSPAAMPLEGFRVSISTASLVQVAASRAFREGPLAHGVVVEPTSLEPLPGDGRHLPLALGLTLWRPVGRGWWRAYEIEGALTLDEAGGVSVLPDTVVEVGHSRGALAADPLAALAQGSIARAVERTLTLSWTGATGARVGDASAAVHLVQLTAPPGAIRADGRVDLLR